MSRAAPSVTAPLLADDVDAEGGTPAAEPGTSVGYSDIFKHFVLLGWTAFGGPAAHIGMFEKLFVERYKWMTSAVHMELVALGQCLPGPTSTQVSFAIGVTKKGIPGGLLSGMLFQYPGLLMMSLVGAGAASALLHPAPWVRGVSAGLSAVGVGLVASAVKGLASKLAVTVELQLICGASAAAAFYLQAWWLFPVILITGALITLYQNRDKDMAQAATEARIDDYGLSVRGGGCLILLWLAILAAAITARRLTPYEGGWRPVHWFEAFYRTGSLIYGGGQVVLPMLLSEMVTYATVCEPAVGDAAPVCARLETTDSWVTAEQFFAGLAVAQARDDAIHAARDHARVTCVPPSQAMPGPLFNISAYLGAVAAVRAGVGVLWGVAACWLGLFGPGIMLIYGVLPFWGVFRSQQTYRRMLPGLNAAAVGLIVAAVLSMTFQLRAISPFPDGSVVLALAAYGAVEVCGVQPPFAVAGGALAGLLMHVARAT